MNRKTTIKPGSIVRIQSGAYVQKGLTGYFAKRTYNVVVREVTKPVTLTAREIMASSYYCSVYANNGGSLTTLADWQTSDPARYDREQLELFPARVIWQGRSYAELQTSVDNVVKIK